jgi:hypothetical protein
METGICVCLTGANPLETAKALCVRLVELKGRPELADSAFLARHDSTDAAAQTCAALAAEGAIVVIPEPTFSPQGERLDATVDPNDIPEFAAEKILDLLAERGLVDLEDTEYSPEEEEEIRKRLADLGYIE